MDEPSIKPLGKNHQGYRGETLSLESTLQDMVDAARQHGWSVDWLKSGADLKLLTLHRKPDWAVRKLYVSAGIHGDEPAGPLAVNALLRDNQWGGDSEIWICPCLNPTGFPLNQRENAQGIDLNRDYRHLETNEVRAHVEWLNGLPEFDLTLCLHEDWEARGFYLYELNPDSLPSASDRVIEAVSAVCPIDRSETIDGRRARKGVICPELDPMARPEWPEAFYLATHKSRLTYTVESPSDYSLPVRVDALKVATRVILDSL